MIKSIAAAVAKVAALFDGLVSYFREGRLIKAGEDKERRRAAEKALKDANDAKKIRNDVADLTDDELDRELWGDPKD